MPSGCEPSIEKGFGLRPAALSDRQALVEFNSRVHHSREDAPPDEGIGFWTDDLISGALPGSAPGDLLLVERNGGDQAVSCIAASLCLISQQWTYADAGASVDFGVGRIELVGSDPAYRGRGLVRALFGAVHQLSRGKGEMLQAISGIPYFYRQFGYERALEMPAGRGCHPARVLSLGEPGVYRVRPAEPADLAFIRESAERMARRYLVSCRRGPELWRYELDGRNRASFIASRLAVIETEDGVRAGFMAHSAAVNPPRNTSISVELFEMESGHSWTQAAQAALHYLRKVGEASTRGGKARFDGIHFWLGETHPLFQVAPSMLPEVLEGGCWYIRVEELPAMLAHLAPVLEARLAGSILAGYSGDLLLSFYRSGVRMAFRDGRLSAAVPWQPQPSRRDYTPDAHGHASFPDLVFLKLLFGYRSLSELLYAFPDIKVHGDEPRALLEILFPKRPSLVWPLA